MPLSDLLSLTDKAEADYRWLKGLTDSFGLPEGHPDQVKAMVDVATIEMVWHTFLVEVGERYLDLHGYPRSVR